MVLIRSQRRLSLMCVWDFVLSVPYLYAYIRIDTSTKQNHYNNHRLSAATYWVKTQRFGRMIYRHYQSLMIVPRALYYASVCIVTRKKMGVDGYWTKGCHICRDICWMKAGLPNRKLFSSRGERSGCKDTNFGQAQSYLPQSVFNTWMLWFLYLKPFCVKWWETLKARGSEKKASKQFQLNIIISPLIRLSFHIG
jgi:hypothetical protein